MMADELADLDVDIDKLVDRAIAQARSIRADRERMREERPWECAMLGHVLHPGPALAPF